jgi:hypothetical protein
VNTAEQPPDWRKLVVDGWPAVTASDLLQGSNEVWLAEGLTPPKDDEAVALAAVGRLVHYGQSIALNLPMSREATMPRLAFYLHRLRLDAAQGLVRSPWLNRITLAQRNDLLVFGRPRRMLRDFVTSTVMRPAVVYSGKPLQPAEFQRTLLVSGHGDLLSTLELLETQSLPFAIVVVVPAQGCGENSCSLIKALPTFFPGVPIVAMGYTGQVLDEPLAMHAWNVRLGDAVPLSNARRQPNATMVEVVAARDPVMNDFVKRLGFLVWNLKRMMEESGGRSEELSALLVVDRALRCLNVPFAVHEQGTLRHVRGGRFPIRVLEGWLEIAERMRGRRGDIQSLLEEILKLIRNNVKQLKDAKPGRSKVILQLSAEAMKESRPLSVLVGGRRDAEILQSWLEEKLGADAIGRINVSAMDGAMAVAPDHNGTVLYAAPLFPSRLHWLGVTAARKIVLCHPFERERICNQVESWWRTSALTSARFGDKRRLWSLDWPTHTHLHDQSVEAGSGIGSFATYAELAIDGEYPQPIRVANLEVSRRFDDWLQALLAEPEYSDAQLEDDPEPEESKDLIVLHLDGQAEPLRWPVDRQIMRLDGDAFALCWALDLAVGNDLVLLGSSEERVATQRELFDMFVQDNHGLKQTLHVAEKWQEFVDIGVFKKKSVAELTRYLKSRKYNITQGAVQHWHAGRVIGPQDPLAIRLLADLADIPSADKMAKMVEQAISVVRNEHRKIGGDLRKAIAMSRTRDVSAVQIGGRRFSREVFDSMVQVCRVVKIDRPSQRQSGFQPPKSIKDVAREFAIQHDTKVIFTSGCERSMNKSGFEDLTAFERILNVLVDGFYPMYLNKSISLKQVEGLLAPIPASYTGNMSDVTKGKYESHYYRLYEGQRVDISRHVKLGRAFDQRYTLRLYFHWDAIKALIVVHHAGEHLPTLTS